MKTESEGWETNRIKSRQLTQQVKEWCGGCDTQMVEIGKKCLHCGWRNKTKKRKNF